MESVFSWCPRGESRCGLPSCDGSAGETSKEQNVSVRQVNMGIRILELCNHTTFSRNQQNHVEKILKLVLEIIYTHSKLNFAQKTVCVALMN